MSLELSSSFRQFRISMAGGGKSVIYAFDQFKLDSDKLMLYRDGEEVSIQPKVAKTLAVLIESAGAIISKEEVIERVWQDSIVEESNLTQYLYLLRKVLGQMPDGRPYIETLRRRGYRFNGEVERIAEVPAEVPTAVRPEPKAPQGIQSQFGGIERDGNVLRVVDWKASEPVVPSEGEPESVQPVAAAAVPPRRTFWLPRLAIAGAVLLLLGAGGVLMWARFMPAATSAEKPQRERTVIRLTNGRIPTGATISPDGNFFTYSENEGDVARLYIQQAGQTSRVEIESSTEKFFIAKTFSPDGQSLYYVGLDRKTATASVYRLPVIGGAPVKLIDDVHGAASPSPDGKEIAFTRLNLKTNDSALVIAQSDGRAERILLQRKSPLIISPSPSWSPDGKTIAFGEYQIANLTTGNHHVQLADVATGHTTPLSDEKWDNLFRLMWAPDGSGVGLIGTREKDAYSTRLDQVYFVTYPGGISHRVTTDGNRHDPDSIGITRKGEILTVPTSRLSQVWAMDADGNATSAAQLTRGVADGRAGLVTLPDGRFAYLARTAEEVNVIVSNADASVTKQIATGFEFVEELRADPLGRFLVFSTLKDGKSHMFRVDIDGGTVKQLSFGEAMNVDSSVSPDGKFLVHDSVTVHNGVADYDLIRVPVEGGEPSILRSRGCYLPTHSPDGSLLSCVATGPTYGIMVVSATDGAEFERYRLPTYSVCNFGVHWTPDGAGLVYIVTEKGVSNLWIQPRDGTKPRRLTNFSSGEIYRYAYSRDGSKIYIARGYPSQDVILIRNYR